MLINDLSKRTGTTVHTIRYYENLGLIRGMVDQTIKTNNYKNYDDHTVERLEIILEAKEVGFTLAEIKKLLESWYGEHSDRNEQKQMFTSKIEEIELKIQQLKQVKTRLQKVIQDFDNSCDC
ncbi:MerR family transcriptional regulator [Arcicella lustrica]|uniref:MerR family transcriptional regulator n=1 Tax=Arcicella lustrica TaxID=2984196 RepID=A0ABU5SQ92_9BACT|nr:MerR family transcriptional regulator [Arcicella sp. DC25W]MEA5429445.1 MerR family transcriptional regulator [Arcicella sp. DC25W]